MIVTQVTIDDPASAFGIIILAWASRAAIGLALLALKSWFPILATLMSTLYLRANMIASGKMFVANKLPSFILGMFDWNPLFHLIDQARGFTFINYFPRNSNLEYAVYVTIALIVLGLMGEFYTRRHASASWEARR